MPAVLGYWKLRGLGQHIKLLLEYTETPYEEKVYGFELDKGEDFTIQWTREKFILGMEFPNLPYYFDGDRKISQSNAIMRYIARQHKLTGKTEDEQIKCDILENQAMDYRMPWVKFCYSKDFEQIKSKYINETLKNMLESLSKSLGTNQWFVGDAITFVDFILYELIDVHRVLDSCCLKNFASLDAFMTRFEALPAINKYMSSSNFLKYPLNGCNAIFGGK